MAIGSSITWGTPSRGGGGADQEPGGGYPEKLPALIRATVLNRGISATTTRNWLTAVPSEQAALWYAAKGIWRDEPPLSAAEFSARRYLSFAHGVGAVGAADRPEAPHVIVVMLGINDHLLHGSTAEETFARHQRLVEHLRLLKTRRYNRQWPTRVLVNTELTINTRDPPEYIDAYNALIASTYGPDVIPMAEEFLARGGTPSMFVDGLHPNCDGYGIMTTIVADALVERGLVQRRRYDALPPCP